MTEEPLWSDEGRGEGEAQAAVGVEPPPSEATKPCPECAERVQAAARVCRYCGYRFDAPATSVRKPKSPGLARVLSFIVIGLGSVYVGEALRGVLLFAAAIGIAVGAGLAGVAWIAAAALAIMIYAIIDAGRGAELANAGAQPRGPTPNIFAVVAVGVIVLVVGAITGSSGSRIDTGQVESEIQPDLERQLQDEVPDATVTVSSVNCIADTGHSGHCVARVSDDLGNSQSIPIEFHVGSDGNAIWQTSQ